MGNDSRPLSPHLQVYRPQLTSVLSIMHRGTGLFMALGFFLLVAWLVAVSGGPAPYGDMQTVLGSAFGRLLLFAWTFAFFYHLCNGVRHLFWDAGMGFEIERAYTTGWMVVGGAVTLTVLAWLVGYGLLGGGA